MEKCLFEVYDPTTKTILASRMQYPLRLAYALTVHRAQGQSMKYLEVDCYSFFAPGQMGIAIGRAITTEGLRILNYNPMAARLKHGDVVYNFYDLDSTPPLLDLQCCQGKITENEFEHTVEEIEEMSNWDNNENFDFDDNVIFDLTNIDMNEDDEEEPHAPTAFQCPYDINTFINDSRYDKSRLIETQLKVLLEKHYSKLQEVFSKNPTKPADFNLLFKKVNSYLISDSHVALFTETFRNITCDKNLISSKLFMWTINQKILTINGSFNNLDYSYDSPSTVGKF